MRLRGFSYTWRKFSGAGRLRAFWHRHIKGYECEVCHHCGCPVETVWWCHDNPLWKAVTGHATPPGSESAAGIWCITCFDKAAKEHTGWIEWAPVNLQHLGTEGSSAGGPK